MEDDATRTTSPRSKSARPPAALFMEPKVPAANGARPEPVAEPGPPPEAGQDVPEPRKVAPRKAAKKAEPPAPAANPEPEPPARPEKKAAKKAEPEPEVPAPRKVAARKAAKKAPEPVPKKRAPAKKAAVPARARPRPPWWTRTPTRTSTLPAYLAEAAVERFGDSAHRYLDWLRDTYPDATPDGLARLVTRQFVRHSGYTALAGPAGPLALLATQARLVLHLAAAYGRDPRDPGRVAELVGLLDTRRLAGPVLARVTGRLLPGAGLVASLLSDSRSLERLAHRAVVYYAVRD
jgi:hypothetical protein